MNAFAIIFIRSKPVIEVFEMVLISTRQRPFPGLIATAFTIMFLQYTLGRNELFDCCMWKKCSNYSKSHQVCTHQSTAAAPLCSLSAVTAAAVTESSTQCVTCAPAPGAGATLVHY
mgnify:CR=1 FL=1